MKSIGKYLKEAGELFETEEYEGALELINEAIELYPEDYDAHMNRKLLLTKLGYYEEMLECQKTCERLRVLRRKTEHERRVADLENNILRGRRWIGINFY